MTSFQRNLVTTEELDRTETKQRFEELFYPQMDRVYSLALRMTKNAEDAEDLTQETYLKAYRFFDNFETGTNAKAWIMTILTNTFRTRYRRRQKEPAYVDFDAVENFLLSDNELPDFRPANKAEVLGIDEITEILKSYVSDDIIHALESIPSQFRLAILLSDVERFNYQEIADIIGTTVGTVKSRIFRGRKLLQKYLHTLARERGII